MCRPDLTQLPQPPARNYGWPWTVQCSQPSGGSPDGSPWPRLTVVTPSYNQGRFIEETIRSVLLQGYPNLEYIIIDGGSTDDTVSIIKRYEPWLSYWVSEPDGGQYDAINKGFSHATGDLMAWLNSDDMYLPWTFNVVGEIFASLPQVEWLTTLYQLHWDERGMPTSCYYHEGYSRLGFFRGEYLPERSWYAAGWIQQESTFWRRSLWERAGGRLDSSLQFAGDIDLWARFFKQAELHGVGVPLAGFRKHPKQKTGAHHYDYLEEAEEVLLRHGGRPYGRLQSLLRLRLGRYISLQLRRMGLRLGLAYPRPVCLHTGGRGWSITTR